MTGSGTSSRTNGRYGRELIWLKIRRHCVVSDARAREAPTVTFEKRVPKRKMKTRILSANMRVGEKANQMYDQKITNPRGSNGAIA